VFPAAQIAVGRELTKLHEEIVQLPVKEAIEWASQHDSLRGEATVMVYPGASEESPEAAGKPTLDSLKNDAIIAFRAGASLRELLAKMKDSGWSRGELYQMLLAAKEESGE
jgi:16S rRNA (cytidine1402-2'-O)-methyltransferase